MLHYFLWVSCGYVPVWDNVITNNLYNYKDLTKHVVEVFYTENDIHSDIFNIISF